MTDITETTAPRLNVSERLERIEARLVHPKTAPRIRARNGWLFVLHLFAAPAFITVGLLAQQPWMLLVGATCFMAGCFHFGVFMLTPSPDRGRTLRRLSAALTVTAVAGFGWVFVIVKALGERPSDLLVAVVLNLAAFSVLAHVAGKWGRD